MNKNDLPNLGHLRDTALEARGLIGAVAGAAADDMEALAALFPVRRDVTLRVSGTSWVGKGPYAQTVAVEGVRADEAGQLVQWTPASASLKAWMEAGILCTGQGAGKLTFTAQEKPAAEIQIYVILQEVQG